MDKEVEDELEEGWREISTLVVDCLTHRHGPNHGINFKSAFDQTTFNPVRPHVILMHPDGKEEDFFALEYFEINYQDIETLDDDFQTILQYEDDSPPRVMTEESEWDDDDAFFEKMMSKRWSRWLFYLFALLNTASFCYVIWLFIDAGT